MPFQSEKQRRYLWANEPEIARDWTDTYGSGIAKALGGRMNYIYGGITHPDGRRGFPGGAGRADYSPMGGSGPDRSHDRGGQQHQATAARQVAAARPRDHHPPAPKKRTGPINIHADTAPVLQKQRQTEFLNEARRQQAEKDYTPMGQIKRGPRVGPKVGGLKNWAANYAGANVGAGIGSMLLGGLPGLILGTLFGSRTSRNLMNPRYQGSTLKDRLRNIFAFSNDYIPDQRSTWKGIETADPSLLINAESDPGYRWRMMQKQKEAERLAALESQEITEEDLMGRVG